MRLKFDANAVQTHDLQIVDSIFHVPKILPLTTEPSGTFHVPETLTLATEPLGTFHAPEMLALATEASLLT